MKFKTLLALLSVLTLGATAFAADETPLSKEMTTINKSLRTLKRQVADASKKEDNLALLAKVKQGLEASTKLEPKKTKDQADKAAYITKYKQEMGDLSKAIDELEAAVKADKPDDAKKALDKIYQIKEKGHKDFGVDED